MAADGEKIPMIERGEEEESDQIVEKLVLCIEKLQEVQDELEKVDEEENEKVLEVKQKYSEIRRPVLVKRSDIIKGIPHFWLTAFNSHPAIAAILNKEDQKIFKFLDSIDVEYLKDVKSGYSITFHFSSNPYFEDETLSKTFSVSDKGITKITGTTIKWKEDRGNNAKKRNKPCPEDSFFTWFSETTPNDIDGDVIAVMIKEVLWPNPLTYFNNDADEDFEDIEDDGEVCTIVSNISTTILMRILKILKMMKRGMALKKKTAATTKID